MNTLKFCAPWFIISIFAGLICGAIDFNFFVNNDEVINLLFTAGTTMFSVCLGVLVSFSYQSVTKRSLKNKISNKLKRITKNVLAMFGFSFCLLLINNTLFCNLLPTFFNFKIFVIAFSSGCLLCFTMSFLHIQKLKEDLDDILNHQSEL